MLVFNLLFLGISEISWICYPFVCGSCPCDFGDFEGFNGVRPGNILVCNFNSFKCQISFNCECDGLCFYGADF